MLRWGGLAAWGMSWLLLGACGFDREGTARDSAGVDVPMGTDEGGVRLGPRMEPPDAGRAARPERPEAPPEPREQVWLAPQLEVDLPCDNEKLAFDFEPAPDGFNMDHAFWLMWFAERSFFSEDPSTAEELRALGFTRFEHIEAEDGLQLYLAGSERAVVMAFRGSTELADWLGNFNFPQDPGVQHGVGGSVHRGFATALSGGFDRIAATLRELTQDDQVVWITGHSLGGAQATLAAARLARAGFRIAPLYIYAAPRAGDEEFAYETYEDLGEHAYRIVNEMDIVPRLPPTARAADHAAQVLPLLQETGARTVRDLNYRHLGQMVWFTQADGTELEIHPAMDDDEEVAYWRRTGQGGTLGALSDNRAQAARHAQQNYLCRLWAARRAGSSPQPAGP